MKFDVVISFAGEDRKLARQINEELKTAGISTFFDEDFQADPLAFFRHMYAEMTPELQRQLAELRTYLERQKAEAQPRDLSRAM